VKAYLHAVLAGCSVLLASTNSAADYPEKPVRVVIPFTPGGGGDIMGRQMAERLSKVLGKNFIAENRPGAGAALGADLVAKSEPDGYTLLAGTSGEMTVVPALNPRTPYDSSADFWPVALVGTAPNILIGSTKLAQKNLAEVIAYAKANPGKLVFGSGGTGTSPHLAGELFKSVAGIDITHAPYKGSGPAMSDLMGGHIDLVFTTVAAAGPLLNTNRATGLGVTSAKRWPQLPQVPTIAEQGFPTYDVVIWYALFAPAKTPKSVIETLRAAADKILSDKEVQAKFETLGVDAGSTELGGAVLQQRITKEVAIWKRVIKENAIPTQ
jgi:tripartite-type tricarboxylate transporter receptor subunit TctC